MRKIISIITVAFVLTICFALVICNAVVNHNASERTFNSTDNIPYRKVAVLLGTGPTSRYSKGPNMFYWNRIHAAIELYRKGKFDTLIISGTKRPGYDEPLIMNKDLVKGGLPSKITIIDGKGTNTFLSMLNMKEVYNQDSVIVISQKWHNQRAIYIADHIGLDAIGYNAQDSKTLTSHITHIREYLARVKMFFSLFLSSNSK